MGQLLDLGVVHGRKKSGKTRSARQPARFKTDQQADRGAALQVANEVGNVLDLLALLVDQSF